MPRFETDSEARRLGDALASLRRARGLSQAEAGLRAGLTSQGWGLYEAGKRSGLFRPDVQRRLTAAIDAAPEDLRPLEGAARLSPGPGMASAGRDFTPPPALTAPRSAVKRLQLSNDDLAPWAASGVVLEYEPGRWPRRDQGCVIDMADGSRLVRLYDRGDEEALFVRGGAGGLGAEERINRRDARAVSAVLARLEG